MEFNRKPPLLSDDLTCFKLYPEPTVYENKLWAHVPSMYTFIWSYFRLSLINHPE